MKKPKYLAPIVPEKCPICGAKWKGGHEIPGKPFKDDRVIVYDCGCSVSLSRSEDHNSFRMLIKNCWCEHNIKSETDIDKIGHPADYDPFAQNVPLELETYYVFGGHDYLIEFPEDGEMPVSVHYGDGVLPVFSTEDKAKDFKKKHRLKKLEVQRVTLGQLIDNFSPLTSHVILDPPEPDKDRSMEITDSMLSDLTTIET